MAEKKEGIKGTRGGKIRREKRDDNECSSEVGGLEEKVWREESN